jgi:hypothetical protein
MCGICSKRDCDVWVGGTDNKSSLARIHIPFKCRGHQTMCLVRHFKPFTLITHVRSKSASKLPMNSVLPASILRSFGTHTHSIPISFCVQMRPSILLCVLSGPRNPERKSPCLFGGCKLVCKKDHDSVCEKGYKLSARAHTRSFNSTCDTRFLLK